MRWSFRIFRISGISIELHLTFLILMLLLSADPRMFLLYVLLFSIVLAHELVHSFVALLHGIKVPRILLTPIGGMASIELPDDPLIELKVSIAGPLFNFMLAAAGIALLGVTNSPLTDFESFLSGDFFGSFGVDNTQVVLSLLVWWNILLGAFNILPAFPMDGGRVLRSVAALWMSFEDATRVSYRVGQVVLLVLAVLGLFDVWIFNIWTTAICFFLSYAGGSELRFVALRRLLGDARMADIMVPGIGYVNGSLSWREFMSRVYRRGKSIYLVVDSDGIMKGAIDITQLREVRPDEKVGRAQTVDYAVAQSSMRAADALKTLLTKQLVLVSEGGVVVGHISSDAISEAAAYFSMVGARQTRLLNP